MRTIEALRRGDFEEAGLAMYKAIDQVDADFRDEMGATAVTPRLREEEADMKLLPWVDPENFNPGYIQRAAHLMPKSGDRQPWQHSQDYWMEKDAIPAAGTNVNTVGPYKPTRFKGHRGNYWAERKLKPADFRME